MKTLTSLLLSALALTLPAFAPGLRGQTTPTVTTLNSSIGIRSGTGLVQGSDGNFYGTSGATVFRITSAGVLTTLHSFAGTDGYGLVSGLV